MKLGASGKIRVRQATLTDFFSSASRPSCFLFAPLRPLGPLILVFMSYLMRLSTTALQCEICLRQACQSQTLLGRLSHRVSLHSNTLGLTRLALCPRLQGPHRARVLRKLFLR